jgi:ADP-ribose pyrophosphatase YjhB (NUDIX family)
MESLWRAGRALLGLILRRPIIGVCVIPVLPDGTVVLIRRRDSKQWGFPGGLMDWGEDVPTTVRRELKEETGLNVVEMGRLVGVYSSPNRDERFHSVCVAVEVFVTGAPIVNDPAEVLAVKAFEWEDLSDLDLAHDHAQHIKDYRANQTVVV